MFRRRKTMLYFAPHQDDELLSMGIDICESIRKGYEVHVILCSDGSKSYVRGLLKNGKGCAKHDGVHCYELSVEEFIQARDREFRSSCLALGVPEENIHIPEKRAVDGSMFQKDMENLMRVVAADYGEDAVVCTLAPDNGPAQHKDHKTLGRAALNLLKTGVVRQVRLFVEPYHYDQIAENPRLIPVEPRILEASGSVKKKIQAAIGAYSLWDPSRQRYAVGYHSVTTEFDDFLKEMKCRFYEKWDPMRMSGIEKITDQNRRWRKLHKQKQLYYSVSSCDAPDLADMELVGIQANELDKYRMFCEKHSITVTEKNLQRLRDGSSYWCLVDPEGTVASDGWLAWKQTFYISEVDFGFHTGDSGTAVLYNFNTRPEFRGRGLYGILLRGIVCEFTMAERFVIYTAPDNLASDHGIRKAGFRFDGALCAEDGSLQRYYRDAGFTGIRRKCRFWGLVSEV